MNPTELKLQEQIDILKEQLMLLQAGATIPHSVEVAFRDRLNIDSFTPVSTSSKVATSENQSVNEGGASSYSVLGIPDGFLQITINSTIYYIPIFT